MIEISLVKLVGIQFICWGIGIITGLVLAYLITEINLKRRH